MAPVLNVYTLPRLADPDELAGGTVVVIDVLRASTTIAYALAAGAKEIIPCVKVDEARAIAEHAPHGCVLGGEREGRPVEGFDLGNSPGEYTTQRVSKRVVVFTTSNGTKAIDRARRAERVLIGSFVNATAIFKELVERQQVHLNSAGTRGQISDDDVLLAGMLVERLQRLGGLLYEQNAQAVTARETWLNSFALPHALGAEPLEAGMLAGRLRKCLGARRLTALGLDDDILAAAQIDRFSSVPEMDPQKMRIRLV